MYIHVCPCTTVLVVFHHTHFITCYYRGLGYSWKRWEKIFFYPIFTELYSYKAKWQIDHPRWLWRLVLIRHRKSTIFDVFAHTGKEKNIRHTASLQPWSKDGRKVKKTYRTSITWVWSLITSQGNHLISIVIIKKRRFRLAEKFCWYL